MIEASCHCGAIRIVLPRQPAYLNRCGCSICRRYGVAWCYYEPGEITVTAGDDATDVYVRDGGSLRFERCRRCGCVATWRDPDPDCDRIAVNANLIDPDALAGVPVHVTPGPPE